MANQEYLDEYYDILDQGVGAWNKWREEHIDIQPILHKASLILINLSDVNFSGVNLSDADLSGANLSNANFSDADLRGADLSDANLRGADLNNAHLSEANLREADLRGADLRGADLSAANLSAANLSAADLSAANLDRSILVETDLTRANLTQCSIYGISVWNVQLEGAKQDDLVITPEDEPTITVDNLEVAQFIYLLLNNPKIREVIDTIAKKAVLILGRFTSKRKVILDALRDELRKKNYLPVVFDFEKPASRDLTETISTLAHMARFVIADITQAKSIPQELERIVPDLPSVPVQPLLHARAKEYGMFEHFKRYPWVLEVYRYTTIDRLLASLKDHVIEPAEQKVKELERR